MIATLVHWSLIGISGILITSDYFLSVYES